MLHQGLHIWLLYTSVVLVCYMQVCSHEPCDKARVICKLLCQKVAFDNSSLDFENTDMHSEWARDLLEGEKPARKEVATLKTIRGLLATLETEETELSASGGAFLADLDTYIPKLEAAIDYKVDEDGRRRVTEFAHRERSYRQLVTEIAAPFHVVFPSYWLA